MPSEGRWTKEQGQQRTLRIERLLGDRARAVLSPRAAEFVMFVLKQGWAGLFGILLLLVIIVSSLFWTPDWPIARYDVLFLFAIGTQAAFLWFGLETWEEARVIVLFHITGTAMELFKVNAGSWTYPEPGFFVLMGVPLFSGFMYASVGSYMARVIRLFDMRFAPYPHFGLTLLLAAAIYVNFFAHHFLPDMRLALFVFTVVLFARTRIWFRVSDRNLWMPLPLAAFLAGVALWVAENVGTATGTWLYSGQLPGQAVSLAKIGSWYLLLYVAFVTVTIVSRDVLCRHPLGEGRLTPTEDTDRATTGTPPPVPPGSLD